MNEAAVTFQGWVGTEVVHRETAAGHVANFRVGVTPRIKRRGDWVDGTTSWFSVTCWRALADNVRDSVHKGDPVVVHGRLRTDVWERADGQSSVTYVVEASSVGHDLTRGTSGFVRSTVTPRAEEEDLDATMKEMLHDSVSDLPQLDGEGRLREEPPAERVA